MDEFVGKVAGFGFPFVMLLVAMAATGLTGAAAITAALAMLGPGGMIGGIMFLGIIGLSTDMLTRHGLEKLLVAIYAERINRGESRQKLCRELLKLPITPALKQTLQVTVGCCFS